MKHARHVLTLLVLIGASAVPTFAQEPDNRSYSSGVARCAQNPPEWYGFDNRPDCFRNWPTGARMWDFVDDFRIGADAQNPSQDSYGNANVWSYRRAPLAWTPGDWANAPLLDRFQLIGDAARGEFGWTNGSEMPFLGLFPLFHGGSSHPSVSEAAVIDWRSPGQGRFWVNLQVVHRWPRHR